MINIPQPALIRLVQVFRLLEEREISSEYISSAEIGKTIGVPAHTVRKDIAHLGETVSSREGYKTDDLKEFIEKNLGLNRKRRCCVVGLGRVGSSILRQNEFQSGNYEIVAGFDTNINLIETIKTDVKLYPKYRMEEIVKNKKIELAFVAVPREAALEVAQKLAEAGIKGILNYSKTYLNLSGRNVFVRNIDLMSELAVLSAMIAQKEEE